MFFTQFFTMKLWKVNSNPAVLVGIQQGSILGPLLFLIYVYDLPYSLVSTVKLFPDNNSLFSTVYDANMSADQLDKYLKKISELAFTNGKWSLIQIDQSKHKKLFFEKTNRISHLTTIFNTVPVALTPREKHRGLYLDEKINLSYHINEKISEANKGIAIIKRLLHIF